MKQQSVAMPIQPLEGLIDCCTKTDVLPGC